MANSSWLGIYKRHVGNFNMLYVCMLLVGDVCWYLEQRGEELEFCTSLQIYMSQVEYEYIKG
jgi:hypothetical protein